LGHTKKKKKTNLSEQTHARINPIIAHYELPHCKADNWLSNNKTDFNMGISKR
jgi:hypothetical protein